MKNIDKRTALRLLKKAVATAPEKVAYCQYAQRERALDSHFSYPVNRPECVAGQVFFGLGVNVVDLDEVGGTVQHLLKAAAAKSEWENDEPAQIAKAFEGLHFTKGAGRLLHFAQAAQDGRWTDAGQTLYPSPEVDYFGTPEAREFETTQRDHYRNNDTNPGHAPWADVLTLTVEHYAKF